MCVAVASNVLAYKLVILAHHVWSYEVNKDEALPVAMHTFLLR